MPVEKGWAVRYSKYFVDQLQTRQHRRHKDDIDKSLNVLSANPYSARRSKRLKGPLAGLRSARIDRRWRLIFRLCEECESLGDKSRRPLDCCFTGETESRTMNVLCISDHYGKRVNDIPDDFDF